MSDSQNTFYWSYSGQEHELYDINELLTTGLLEEDPVEYYNLLTIAHDNGIKLTCLNDRSSKDTWFSPHIICLSFLVGDRSEYSKSYLFDYPDTCFYGDKTIELSEELGMNILKLQVSLGADIKLKNYYEKDIIEILEDKISINSRENNLNFIEFVRRIYNEQ